VCVCVCEPLMQKYGSLLDKYICCPSSLNNKDCKIGVKASETLCSRWCDWISKTLNKLLQKTYITSINFTLVTLL